MFEAQSRWPTATAIDRPLLTGAALFGIGWGLVGLCPGPAIADLATASPGVILFVVAMAIGMVAHDQWQSRAAMPAERKLAGAADRSAEYAADGIDFRSMRQDLRRVNSTCAE